MPRPRSFPSSLSAATRFATGEPAPYQTSLQHERQQAILDVAETLLAEKGLLQTGLQEIGARIGFPPYAVRAQFGNKELIIEALLDRYLNTLLDRAAIFEKHNTDPNPIARLQAAIIGLLETVNANKKAQRVFIAASSGASPHLARSLRLRQQHLVHYYAGLIVAAVPKAEGHTELAMPLAMNLMAMIAWHIAWFRDQGAVTRREFASLLTHMTVAGAKSAIAVGLGTLETE